MRKLLLSAVALSAMIAAGNSVGRAEAAVPSLPAKIEARSNGTGTVVQCYAPTPGFHFSAWKIAELTVNGDGLVWFTKQSPKELCARADASVTKNGANSYAGGLVTAEEKPN